MITRLPVVDDTGDKVSGTAITAAWWSQFLDTIDALFQPLALGSHYDLAINAGQHDNVDPGVGAKNTLWFLNAPSATYLTGIVAPAGGQGALHILINVGGPIITLANEFASTPQNRIVGIGYANTELPPWHSTFIIYDPAFLRWIVIK